MTGSGERVRALRGATTADADRPEDIVAATRELLEALFERNGVAHDDLVSLLFTATPDLVSEFPAAAARELGISDVPLLCATEIAVPSSVPRCIRVLVHTYTDRAHGELRHVYLAGARQLRTDLAE